MQPIPREPRVIFPLLEGKDLHIIICSYSAWNICFSLLHHLLIYSVINFIVDLDIYFILWFIIQYYFILWLQLWTLGTLSFDSCDPLMYHQNVFFLLFWFSTSSLSGTENAGDSHCTFHVPILESDISLRSPSSFD